MAIYAGVKIPRDYEYPANLTLKEREDHHKNLLDYDDDYNIDVPPHLDDIVVYRASLGHKVISYYHSKCKMQSKLLKIKTQNQCPPK